MESPLMATGPFGFFGNNNFVGHLHNTLMWITRRAHVVRRVQMSSCYLVPALLVLAGLNVHTFDPIVPALVVIGCVTTLMFHARGKNTLKMAFASIVGHLILLGPCAKKKQAPMWPSFAVFACIFLIYRTCDTWPYPISPLEFATLATGAIVLFA